MVATLHDDLLRVYTSYLDARGYQAVKIPETSSRTPDLEVSGEGGSFLNELKSPDLLLDQTLGLYKFTTTNSKLLQFVHTAIKQFKDHDASHSSPWVITFASVNFQLNWRSLFEAMQGGSIAKGKGVANWTQTGAFKRWEKNRYIADLYIWIQVNNQTMDPYQASFITNDRSPHSTLVEGLVANLRSVPLSDADTSWLLV